MKTRINFIDNILKMKYNFSPVLNNQFVLYFFCFIAILDIIYLVNMNDMQSLMILILVGLLTSFFNKNMIVILVFTLTITHVLKYGVASNYEGMEDKDESTDSSNDVMDSSNNVMDLSSNSVKPKVKSAASTTAETKPSQKDIMKEYEKFKEVQETLTDKMPDLMQKAESFIDKFEQYKGIQGFNDMLNDPVASKQLKDFISNYKK